MMLTNLIFLLNLDDDSSVDANNAKFQFSSYSNNGRSFIYKKYMRAKS